MIVESLDGVTLVGGGPVSAGLLARALRLAPRLVAADGGANTLLRRGLRPEAVIGDFDSISPQAREFAGTAALHPIAEQETTDFDKALRMIAAPFVLGLGFTGGRADHGLAALNALARRRATPCLLLGQGDVIFLCPDTLALDLTPGSRLSLFPLSAARGTSLGLRWPIDGLDFAPDGMIGTSNEVVGPVRLTMQGAMLVILPATALPAALSALVGPSAARGR